ncbi:MAG: hypothetical protein RBS22_13735, partial [Spongiibacteraceae bacterium]|nr:hypothetical protein [Spongiibacteraceae bacterium]
MSQTTSGTKPKTAFLVVHGIGQHDKYDTLAGFAAGLLQSMTGHTALQRVLVPVGEGVDSAQTLSTPERQVD